MPRKKTKNEVQTNRATVERKSDREVVVARTFDAPAHLAFEAWTRRDLLKQWWVPRSMGMTPRSCELDVRTGAPEATLETFAQLDDLLASLAGAVTRT